MTGLLGIIILIPPVHIIPFLLSQRMQEPKSAAPAAKQPISATNTAKKSPPTVSHVEWPISTRYPLNEPGCDL